MKTYLRIAALCTLLMCLFPVLGMFGALFFYEKFSWGQVARQVGAQVVLVHVAGLIGLAIRRVLP